MATIYQVERAVFTHELGETPGTAVVAYVPQPVLQFLADAQWAIVSDAAAPVACMEHRALRRSWLRALAAAGLTEEQARDQGRGLWTRVEDPK